MVIKKFELQKVPVADLTDNARFLSVMLFER
jgi:hypothetical protein